MAGIQNWRKAKLIAEQSIGVGSSPAFVQEPGLSGPDLFEAQASVALAENGLGRPSPGVLRLSGKGEGKPKQKLKGRVKWKKSGPWGGK